MGDLAPRVESACPAVVARARAAVAAEKALSMAVVVEKVAVVAVWSVVLA